MKLGMAQRVIGVIMVLFILGTVGATAVGLAANSSKYAGAPATVITMFSVGVVVMSGVAIILYMIPNRAVALSPYLTLHRVVCWFRCLLKKLGRS